MKKNSNPTQCDKVLKYMKEVGEITPLDALREFGIMRLGARIWELKHEYGYDIKTRLRKGTNTFGDPVTFAAYSLAKENE